MPVPRLRQVALVARDIAAATSAIESYLGLHDPFHDKGVGEFGLTNAVYEIGDTFLEVVSPVRDDTTAGRYLERRGGDAGYMAIFQVADADETRTRAGDLGMRRVWDIDLPDISSSHVHPRDLRGAIVSFDAPVPPESWRWGGPRWTGHGHPDEGRGIAGITVRLVDVDEGAPRWADLLAVPLTDNQLVLDGGRQVIRFEEAAGASDEGIAAVDVRVGDEHGAGLAGGRVICGVRFAAA